jgi:hypothetical protein
MCRKPVAYERGRDRRACIGVGDLEIRSPQRDDDEA